MFLPFPFRSNAEIDQPADETKTRCCRGIEGEKKEANISLNRDVETVINPFAKEWEPNWWLVFGRGALQLFRRPELNIKGGNYTLSRHCCISFLLNQSPCKKQEEDSIRLSKVCDYQASLKTCVKWNAHQTHLHDLLIAGERRKPATNCPLAKSAPCTDTISSLHTGGARKESRNRGTSFVACHRIEVFSLPSLKFQSSDRNSPLTWLRRFSYQPFLNSSFLILSQVALHCLEIPLNYFS